MQLLSRGFKWVMAMNEDLVEVFTPNQEFSEMTNGNCLTQIIDDKGVFNKVAMDNFVETVKLGELGTSYGVVSIIGTQSSGKSTLMNNLFHTNFRMMDAGKLAQTTQGIWLANCVEVEQPIMVMDLEGCDGKERGEDNVLFEKQSALFALAVSNVVLINMWSHDLDRVQGASRPLLKTVIQVMIRLFTSRKPTIMFVLRDRPEGSSLENLESVLMENLEQIWDSVLKLQTHTKSTFREYFNVEFEVLAHFVYQKDLFKDQVVKLKERILKYGREGYVLASDFSFSTQEIWKTIKENKDLDLPTHKIMVATVRCEEIADEQLRCFSKNEDWCRLKKKYEPDFEENVSRLLKKYLSEYDMKAKDYDDRIRTVKHKRLESDILQLIKNSREHHASVATELSKITSEYERKLKKGLSKPCRDFLSQADDNTWSEIRRLFQQETVSAASGLSSAVAHLGIDKETLQKMIEKQEKFATSIVELKSKEEAGVVLTRMKERFSASFSFDSNSQPRIWTGNENVTEIARNALYASVKVLSVMAAIQLHSESYTIEKTLVHSLLGNRAPLTLDSWEEVLREKTLITPEKCQLLWGQFRLEIEGIVDKVQDHVKELKAKAARDKTIRQVVDVTTEVVSGFAAGAVGTGVFIGTAAAGLPMFAVQLALLSGSCCLDMGTAIRDAFLHSDSSSGS